MAVAIKPFRKLQIGKQSSFGTLVAATAQVLGEWSVRVAVPGEEPQQLDAGVSGPANNSDFDHFFLLDKGATS